MTVNKILAPVLVPSWIGQSVGKGGSNYMHFILHAFYTTLSIKKDQRMDIPRVGS